MSKLKKISKVAIACIYALFAIFSTTTITNASSKHTASWSDTGYSSYRNFSIQDKFSGTSLGPGTYAISNFEIDGQKAYCVEPDVQISNNINYAHEKIYGRNGFYQAGFIDSQINRMAYISSLGYGFQGDNSNEMLAATQLLIWQVKKPNGFSSIPAALQAKMDIINSRLNVIYSNVSFAGNKIELEGYGKENAITVNDTSETFSAYLTNTVPTGIHIERVGNKLTIWADKNANETGVMAFDAYYLRSEATNTEIGYYEPLNQTLAVFGKKDPKEFALSYKILVQPETVEVSSNKIGKGKVDVDLSINKTDKDSKKGIEGIKFEFFRDSISLGVATTDKNGKATAKSHIEQDFTSATYTGNYVDNWIDLSTTMQQYCINQGWFSNQSDAQKSVDDKAQSDVDKQINEYQTTKHVYKAVELDSGDYYYLDPQITVSKEMTGDGNADLVKDNQRYTLSILLEKFDEDIHQGMAGMTKQEFEDYLAKGGKVQTEVTQGNNRTQGNATLKGAIFGLYASNDIYNPENKTDMLYHKGDKIMEVTTDKNGHADTSDYIDKNGKKGLYFGDVKDESCWYYWKEVKSPQGYEKTDLYYPITKEMMTQDGEPYHFAIKTQISDTVRTGKFEIGKFMTDGDNSEITNAEIGAEFTTVLERFYNEANGDMKKALEIAKKNGTCKEYAVVKTDKTGTAYSPELAYGTHVIQQTAKGDNGKETDILAEPFKFIVSETTDGQTLVYGEDEKGNQIGSSSDGNVHYYINNRPFKSYVQVVKKDIETGKIVSLNHATFKVQMLDDHEKPIKNYDKKTVRTDENGYISMKVGSSWYNEFTTNADNRISLTDTIGNFFIADKNYEENEVYDKGKVKLPVTLPSSTYRLSEIKAPNQYLLAEYSKSFKISSSTVSGTDDDNEPVVEIEMKNQSVKGKIKVSKQGEVLTSVDKDENGNLVFNYIDAGLIGAIYEIKAHVDILDPADGTVMFKEGTLMDTITTTADGIAESKKLPLGEYDIREKTSPNGFVHSSEVKTVKLEYKDQETEIVFDNASFYNERQKVSLEVIKKDAEEKTPLSGAKFGIYAKEDIKNNKGDVIVEKGRLIETAISNDDGEVLFKADFPLTYMEIKELQAPIGYATSNEIINVDATYQGQDIKVIENTYEFTNDITKVEISKQDITDESEIAGALLSVYPKGNKGETFDTWVSGDDGINEDGSVKPHIIKGLEVGKTYVLHEESSPYGFAIAQDVEFAISDTGDVQKVAMKDQAVFGQLKWNKSGKIFNQVINGQTEFGKTLSPIWNESNLLGANITIYAANDIKIGNNTYYKANEKIETLESDWESVQSKKLPVGRYYYIESNIPHGYVGHTEKVFFEVEDNQSTEIQVITSTLENKRPSFDIDMIKVLEEQDIFKNPNAYKDVIFGIFAREDIYDYMGNVAIDNGSMIATTGIDEKGHLVDVPDLPNGLFFLKELQTNSQYVLNDTEYDFEIGYHGQDVSHYVIHIGTDGKIDNELARGEIRVKKLDTLDLDKQMIGVNFNLSAKEDMSEIVATAMTGDDSIAYFKDLELGTYFIQESQVEGYVLNQHIYKIEVKQDGDLLTIECENQPTEIIFSKQDMITGKELAGAYMQLSDKESGEVMEEWVSKEESHIIHYLVEGKEYVLSEIIAPSEYEIAESITFKAEHGTKVIMKDKKKPVEEVKTGDTTTKAFYVGLLIVSGVSLVFLKRRNKTNKK